MFSRSVLCKSCTRSRIARLSPSSSGHVTLARRDDPFGTGFHKPGSAGGIGALIPIAGEKLPCGLMNWMFTESGTEPCWKCRSGGVTPLGGVVRLELSLDDRHVIHLELPSDQIRDLELTPDERPVFVVPRMINIFDVRETHVPGGPHL